MKSLKLLMMMSIFTIQVKAQTFEKTLFVDYFGGMIFNVNEDNATTGATAFERQDDLIKYAEANSFTTLILKNLDIPIAGSNPMFNAASATPISSFTNAKYGVLNAFIHQCKANGIIKYIAAADKPYYDPYNPPAVPNHSYMTNYFFDHIKEFNLHYYTYFNGTTTFQDGIFDMIYGEEDYWGTENPTSDPKDNYLLYYKPGLAHMNNVKNSANSQIDIVATYLGNLNKLNYGTAPIDAQTQANEIDDLVDWVYLAFYFGGDNLDNNLIRFFQYDATNGRRLERFANSAALHNKPTNIIPLFSSAAGNSDASTTRDGDASGHDYFGDYIDFTVNWTKKNFSTSTSWHGSLDDIYDLKFLDAYNNITNPYSDGTITSTMAATYGYDASSRPWGNKLAGVGWFKYSTMPDSRLYLKAIGANDAISDDVYEFVFPHNSTNPITIYADELINTGTDGCISCRPLDGITGDV